MKTALIFTAKYSQDRNDGWLADELIDQLESSGYKVTVFAVGDITFSKNESVNLSRSEYLFPTNNLSKYRKYLILWPNLVRRIREDLKRTESYDLLIAFAPLSVILPLILITARSKKISKKLCIVFDFFPIHQVQLKLINWKFERIFKIIESHLLQKFDLVTGMSPKNIEVIKQYYNIKPNKTKEVNLWGIKRECYQMGATKVTDENIKMVFGGQIVPGRSIDQLIEMVSKLRDMGLPITLTVFSTGLAFEKLKNICAVFSDFIIFKERLPRNQYISEITKYDVGAIVTDPRVTTPTFPSKIIDYMNSGLSCFCMIEKGSDLADVINDRQFLHVNHFDLSSVAIQNAAQFLASIKGRSRYNHPDFYEKFTVEYAVNSLIN